MPLSEHMRPNLKGHPLMEGLYDQELDFLLQIGDERIYQKNEVVAQKGERSDELYLIHEGAISFRCDPLHQQTYVLQAPAVLGETSFLNPRPHPFDVFAQEERTHLYVLRRQELEKSPLGKQLLNKLLLNLIRMDLDGSRPLPVILHSEQQIKTAVKEQEPISVKEENPQSLNQLKEAAIIKWLPKNWNARARQEIEKLLDEKYYSAQEICIRQNDPIESFYLLVEGELNALQWDDAEKQEVLVAVLHPGDHFGEASILDPMDSPYTIKAVQPSTLLILEGKKIDENIDEKVVQKLLDVIEDRDEEEFIWKNNDVVSQSPPIPASPNPVPLNVEKGKESENLHKQIDQQSTSPSSYLDILQDQPLIEGLNQEESLIQQRNQQLTQKKSLWLFSIIGLVLSYLEPYKGLGYLSYLTISLFQIFTPVIFILTYLREPLKNWGWNNRFLGRSLLQALLSIVVVGGVFEIMNQVADLENFGFYSTQAWNNITTFSLSSVAGYFIFVAIQEWLRRGVIALSLQKGFDSKKGWGIALLSALLFIGFSAPFSPLFACALFVKDFTLAQFFLRTPHLSGVILVHFILGIFFASLGWFTL